MSGGLAEAAWRAAPAAEAALAALGEGLIHAAWLVAPAAGAAGGAALAIGWLCHRLGVTDPAPVLLARATAVLAVVWWFGAAWLSEGAGYTRGLWALLPAIGRGG
ncbi:hypothetical protein SAMN02745121_07232 [Nannocystis exedens]|uniref:Uncharacterized protein n=1 Tax=Nannocystis exedens TaxID=54 RepID=A0A1I2GFN9_9BACT|nr:hypothetical protein [Nannocystis exedens]PCC69992.1 hypothetical protein NAEX_03020 [Nannocystis exedens]SFF15899.1 hypothetical protein SAMN02745121_07232 [Nannocystis exedens]